MTSGPTGITLGCTTCGLAVVLEEQDEVAVRAALGGFFTDHADCAVYIDVSHAGARLPQPERGSHSTG